MQTRIEMCGSAAERMRLHRQRQRNKVKCLWIELRAVELEALVAKGFLAAHARQDEFAIIEAIYKFLEGALAKTP